jgi:hypothetical protein
MFEITSILAASTLAYIILLQYTNSQ